MMDDVDLYLSLRPRAKEWMPDIPGVHKLSRTDAQLDLDSILANIATTQTSTTSSASHAQPTAGASSSSSGPLQQGAAAANNAAESDRASSRKAQRAAAAAAAAAGKPVKAEGKEQAAARDADKSALHHPHSLFCMPRLCLHSPLPARLLLCPLPACLQCGGGHCLISTRSSAGQNQRREVSARPHPIPTAHSADCPPHSPLSSLSPFLSLPSCRVLLESAHLTASQLRVELDAVRSDLLQYEDAILSARREIAATKRERREVEVHYHLVRDEYDEQHSRMMQTRKELEESETELRVRLSKAEVEQVDLTERLNQLRQLEDEFNKKEHIIEELMLVNKQWERQIQLWEAVRGKKSSTVTSPSTSASSSSNPASNASPLSPAGVREMTALLQSAPSGVPGERSAELIPAELFDAVKQFAGKLTQAEQMVASLEAENRDLKVRHNDAARSIQSLILQLDRSTSVHADLNNAMRAMEGHHLEETVKVEHSLKTIHLLQKQKKDQQTLLIGYEERMKHFQQLLTAADVRADSANTFLSELLRGWNVLKYGNRQMNEVVKRMRAEYRKMRKERNEAYELLHDKLLKHSSASASGPSSPQDAAEFYADKERKVELHYRQVTEENSRLHEQLDEERERADKLSEAAQSLVTKTKYDEDVQALHFEVDEMRRFVKAAEDKARRLEDAAQEEKEGRKLAEAEVARLKEEREKAEAARAREAEAAAARAAAADSDTKAKVEDTTDKAANPISNSDSAPLLEAAPGDAAMKREGGEEMKGGGGEEERSSKKRKLDVGSGAEMDVGRVKEEGGEEKGASEEGAEELDTAEQKENEEGLTDVVMDDAKKEGSHASPSSVSFPPP